MCNLCIREVRSLKVGVQAGNAPAFCGILVNLRFMRFEQGAAFSSDVLRCRFLVYFYHVLLRDFGFAFKSEKNGMTHGVHECHFFPTWTGSDQRYTVCKCLKN